MRVTVAVPEQYVDIANELAKIIGRSEYDHATYGDAVWQDTLGNRYAVASVIVSDSFPAVASSPLVLPAWGGNLVAASQAQALISIGSVASPTAITAVFGDDPQAALATLGVTAIAE